MFEPVAQLRITNLTPLDRHDLRGYLQGSATFEEEELTSDKIGEPITIAAIVVLSAVAIKGISLWLMKRRVKNKANLRIEKTLPDGTVIAQSVEFTFSSSTPPDTEVIQKVGEALGAEDNLIAEALKISPPTGTK